MYSLDNDTDLPPNPITSVPQARPEINSTTEEAELVRQFDPDGTAAAAEVLGYDDTVDEDYYGEDEEDICNGEDDLDLDTEEGFKAYQTRVRVDAAKRAEGNRRRGGVRTQAAVVRSWMVRYPRNVTIWFTDCDYRNSPTKI